MRNSSCGDVHLECKAGAKPLTVRPHPLRAFKVQSPRFKVAAANRVVACAAVWTIFDRLFFAFLRRARPREGAQEPHSTDKHLTRAVAKGMAGRPTFSPKRRRNSLREPCRSVSSAPGEGAEDTPCAWHRIG